MGLLDPTPPPYDALEWAKKPFAERAKMVCAAWALQGYGSPLGVYAAYLLKIALYVAVWVAFCSTSPALGGPRTIASWWLHPIAFQKAIVWSMLFEVLGLRKEDEAKSDDSALDGVMQLIIAMRAEAKATKNFALSDRIRDQLAAVGIAIKDTKEGSTWGRN